MNPIIQLMRFERLEPMVLDDGDLMETSLRLDNHIKARGLVPLEKTDPLSQAMSEIALGLEAEFYSLKSDSSGTSAVMSILEGSYGMDIYFVLEGELFQIETLADALKSTIRIEGPGVSNA